MLQIASALSAALALIIVILDQERRTWLDPYRLVLVCLALLYFPTIYDRVGGDGREYYVFARSAWFDHDFDFQNDYEGLRAQPVIGTTGVVTTRFPMGVSLLWTPALIATHAVAGALSLFYPGIPTDGFAGFYQAAAVTTTFVLGMAALVLLDRLLRTLYPAPVALLTVLSLWLATPLHFYLVGTPSMSHGASAFACTLFVTLWWRARGSLERGPWLVTASAAALMVLVRGQDGLLVGLALLDLMWRQRRDAIRPALTLIFGVFAAGLLQLAIWWKFYGAGLIQAVRYNGHLAEHHAHFLDFVLSARHGVFTWTPLFALAACGWILWLRRDRWLACLFITGFVAMCLLLSTQVDWWGGDSFGQRRILGLTPLFALGLCEVLDFARRRPLVLAGFLLSGMAAWNQQFVYIYNSEMISGKGEAVTLDQLATKQVDVAYRKLLRWEGILPRSLWVLAYDNLKGVWIDEGPRALRGPIDIGAEPEELPYLLVTGWYDRVEGDGTRYRLSRGRRSVLRLPIRNPADFLWRLRLKRGTPALPVTISFAANGHTLGELDLPETWLEHGVRLPADALRAGLNDFELRYSANPKRDLPDHQGKDAALALDWIAFDPVGDASN